MGEWHEESYLQNNWFIDHLTPENYGLEDSSNTESNEFYPPDPPENTPLSDSTEEELKVP